MNLDLAYQKLLRELQEERPSLLPEDQKPWVERFSLALRALSLPQEAQKRLEAEFLEFGPLNVFLDRSDITELILNGPEQIWYETKGRLVSVTDRFLGPITYRNTIERICLEAGTIVDLNTPFADGAWRNHRLHVTIPPVTPHWTMTLRRGSTEIKSFDRLIEEGWTETQTLSNLLDLVRRRKNILIVGPTSSGKTTILNLLLQTVESKDRAVILEDTSELLSPNSASIKLLTRFDSRKLLADVDLTALVRQALRMRPDRLIMGEVRGAEAKDLLMALATGHRGCMGTLHADSARQALLRLEMLIQLGAPQWSLGCVRSLIQLSLDAIVVLGKTPEGERKLEGIYHLGSLEEQGLLLEKIA